MRRGPFDDRSDNDYILKRDELKTIRFYNVKTIQLRIKFYVAIK